MSMLANNEDPDEMQHNAAFYQGLYCLLRQNWSSEKKYYFIYKKPVILWYIQWSIPSLLYQTRRKKVRLTRKCHNHRLETNPLHLEEELKKDNNNIKLDASMGANYTNGLGPCCTTTRLKQKWTKPTKLQVESERASWKSAVSNQCLFLLYNMGLVVRKPVFGFFDKASFKPVSTATETS